MTLEKADKQYQVKVAVITENYMSHYLYMTPAVYKQTFGEEPDYQDIVFTIKAEYRDEMETVGTEILTHPASATPAACLVKSTVCSVPLMQLSLY